MYSILWCFLLLYGLLFLGEFYLGSKQVYDSSSVYDIRTYRVRKTWFLNTHILYDPESKVIHLTEFQAMKRRHTNLPVAPRF